MSFLSYLFGPGVPSVGALSHCPFKSLITIVHSSSTFFFFPLIPNENFFFRWYWEATSSLKGGKSSFHQSCNLGAEQGTLPAWLAGEVSVLDSYSTQPVGEDFVTKGLSPVPKHFSGESPQQVRPAPGLKLSILAGMCFVNQW